MTESNLLDAGSLPKLLDILADGYFHSGEELGEALNMSRAAVWKHLQKLEQLNLNLLSVKGKGYCLEGGLDLLDEAKISHFLSLINQSSPAFLKKIKIAVFAQIDSTNTYLMKMEDARYNVCFAESQTAGRGRRGRLWASPFAQNIYFSLGWGFGGGVAALEGLSLAVGLVIVRVLARLGATGFKLKWPNDVLYKQKKLAGILIEIQGDPTGDCRAVIGVGLNIKMQQNAASSIDQPWVDLHNIFVEQHLTMPSRSELAALLLNELASLLENYEKLGFSAYLNEWLILCAYRYENVELQIGNHWQAGILLGVNKEGALMLRTSSEEMLFHGGEISLRAHHDS